MPDELMQKAHKIVRYAELDEIMVNKDQAAAYRWLREETLIMAEETVKGFFPVIRAEYNVPDDVLEAVGYIITSLADQLKHAPLPEG